MKKQKKLCTRVGSIILCLALLCSVMGGFSGISVAAQEGTVKTYDVDFADLAALVDEADYDETTGRYHPTIHDDAINTWANDRFALVFNREVQTPAAQHKKYLGQSSFTILTENDSTNGATTTDTWASPHYWVIDKDGYLHHNTGSIECNASPYRKGDTLVLKTAEGALAQLTNMEARVVFNTDANKRGAVYVSMHEAVAGLHTYWNAPNGDLIGVTVDENSTGVFYNYINEKKNSGGSEWDLTTMTDISGGLTANTDYELYVKAVGGTLTVKVTEVATNTVVLEETKENVLHARNGYLSVATTNADRAIKSIKVTELDENGNPVDFGTTTTAVEGFEMDVRNLLSKTNGCYTNTNNSGEWWYMFDESSGHNGEEDCSTIRAFLDDKFAFYYNNAEHYYETEIGKKTSFEGQEGDFVYYGQLLDMWLYRMIDWTGVDIYTQRNFMSKISAMAPRGDNGEELVLKNFETTFWAAFDHYNDQVNGGHDYEMVKGWNSVLIGFRQDAPGKFTLGNNVVNKDQAFICISPYGVTVAGGTDIKDTMFNTHTTPFANTLPTGEVKINVKVVEDKCWLTIWNFNGDTALFDNGGEPFTVNYDKEGYFAYGLGGCQNRIANITLNRLDAQGNPVDIDRCAHTDTTAESGYDQSNHWNLVCTCGVKVDATAHELTYVVDGDKH